MKKFIFISESSYSNKRMAIAVKYTKPAPGRAFSKRVKAQKVVKKLSDIKKKKNESSKPFLKYNRKKHSKSGGLNDKFRQKYNRETGSNLKRPVTQKNPGPKAAARRKSFCARMSGVKGPTSIKGKLTPKGAALKKWNCS
jgi:hypothetical protein